MKKLLILALILTMIIVPTSLGLDMRITEEKISPLQAFFINFANIPFEVTGGSIENIDEIMKAEPVDAQFVLQFRNAAQSANSLGYTHKIDMFWVRETDGMVSPAGTRYFKTVHNAGDYVRVYVFDVSTSNIPDSWCGQAIKLGGNHFIASGDIWVKDGTSQANQRTVQGRTSQNLLFLCEGTQVCEAKDLEYVCMNDGLRYMKQQSSFMDENGQCRIGYSLRLCPSGLVCNQGSCVESFQCSNGDTRCVLSDKVSQVCSNNDWFANPETLNGVCVNGCEPSTGRCIGESPSEDGDCLENCNPDDDFVIDDPFCVSCTTDSLCADGSVFLACINGCFESTTETDCPGGVNPFIPGQQAPKKFFDFENDPVTAYGIIIVGLLLIGTVTYLIVRRRK